MSDNELNALDAPGEVPPNLDLQTTAPGTETQPAPGHVDDPPDPAAIKAETEALEATRKKAEDDARYWRKQKAEARKDYFKPEPPAAPPAKPAEKPRPEANQFDDYNDFVRADNDWAANRAVEQKKAQWDREAEEKTQNANTQQRMTSLQEKINEGYAKYDDFEDVALDPTVPITPVIHEVLAETDNPADIAYYLGINRTEAIQISRMTPIAAARAIAKIEVQIASGQPPPPKKTTTAPPPIKPVGSNAPAATKDPEDMTQKEFNEHRKKQGARPY